jgi:hypothetical protein
MPCRVSSDVHEWTNDLPAVPAWGPVNPLYLDEQSRDTQRGEKSPWSFTAACRWDVIAGTECRWEPSKPCLRVRWRRQCNTTYLRLHLLPGLTLEQRQVGSLAGAAPPRKNIEGALSSTHPGQNPGVECKSKSRADWILNGKGSRGESLV